eukprot:TRINITY_DN11840_c0_g1_i1.p1 TRINITY_DN11840_c0_g1~~TRINITY_DN11840_c0_g1_i1.p1  ORF type:complete len:288 (+),score=47.80 TRINITY_DN11840_c0_g1_i1:693-1556(+)
MFRRVLVRAAHHLSRATSKPLAPTRNSGEFCNGALRAGFLSSEAAAKAAISPTSTSASSNGLDSRRAGLSMQTTFTWPMAVAVSPPVGRVAPQESPVLAEEGSDEEEPGSESYVPRERTIGRANNSEHIGYGVVGRLEAPLAKVHPKSVFAVVQVGSHQFKVTPGDAIYVEKLLFAEVNDKLALDKVLMLGSRWQTIIGRPILPGAHVVAVVEEHALDAKVIVFKKKRRKNYRRHRGHRQELTRLRILDVVGISVNEGKGKGKGAMTGQKSRDEATALDDGSSAIAA